MMPSGADRTSSNYGASGRMKQRLLPETSDGWEIPLWRYGTTKGRRGFPASLVHGYPGDHRTFDTASGKPGLAPFLCNQGREVWVVEYRTMGESRCRTREDDRPWSLKNYMTDILSDFSRLISAPLYRGDLGAKFRTHTGFLSLSAGLDFPTMKLDLALHLCAV